MPPLGGGGGGGGGGPLGGKVDVLLTAALSTLTGAIGAAGGAEAPAAAAAAAAAATSVMGEEGPWAVGVEDEEGDGMKLLNIFMLNDGVRGTWTNG